MDAPIVEGSLKNHYEAGYSDMRYQRGRRAQQKWEAFHFAKYVKSVLSSNRIEQVFPKDQVIGSIPVGRTSNHIEC